MSDSMLIKSLTYLGAVPFFIAIYIHASNQVLLGIQGSQWFLTYGLVILSFMAGTLWGRIINETYHIKRLALATNLITLVAWFTFLLLSTQIALVILALGFVALYILEAAAMKQVERPAYYLSLRFRVTVCVLLAHVILYFQV